MSSLQMITPSGAFLTQKKTEKEQKPLVFFLSQKISPFLE